MTKKTPWTLDPTTCYRAALDCARGEYQRNVLREYETLSGAGLQGRAATYSGRYKASRCGLLSRVRAAGIPFCFVRPAGGGATKLAWGVDAVLAAVEDRCAHLSGLPVWTHAELVAMATPELIATLAEDAQARVVLASLAAAA